MAIIPTDWTREDFLALALHYAANADLHITTEEQAHIRQQCGAEHYAKAAAFSEKLSDYELIQALMAGKERFFAGDVGKRTLDMHLRALFQTDDDYSPLEKSVLGALDRLW